MPAALVVIARAPVAGASKTRLCPPLDADQAAAHAVADVGEPLLIVGMDTPQLTRALLAGALDALAAPSTDAVLGPTLDGGYWTIGLREPDPRAFDGVPMSTARTAAAQRARLAELGLRTTQLGTLRDVDVDVDDYADATAVAALAPWSRFAATYELLGVTG